MLKHFVELDHWGGTVTITEVSSRKPENLSSSTKDLVRFRFFDRKETIINGELSYEDCKNFSCWYYVGKRLNISEVKRNFPNSKELIFRMQNNKADAVLIREELLLMLENNDKVVSTK